MDYTSFLADYAGSIADILLDWPLNEPPPLPESYIGADGYNSSPTAVRLAWQILVLLCKIDGKTESYKDPAISYLFLANNLQYVVARVRISNLKLLLGDDWLDRHEEKVKQYSARYEKLAWGKVLASLPEHPPAEISPDQAEECFRRFNDAFEEAYKKQTTWIVPDRNLREQIKTSLAEKLIPGYRALFEMNRVGSGNLVKFTPEDIRYYITNLLAGDAPSWENSSREDKSNNGSNRSFKTLSFYRGRSGRCGRSRGGGNFLR